MKPIKTIRSQLFRLTSTFATFFDACLPTLAHLLSTSPLFPSPFLEQSLKWRKEYALVRSSAFLKSFLNWSFTFLICLKNGYCNFEAVNFFSLPDTQIRKFRSQPMNIFFHCLIPFSGFSSQSNLHSEDVFVILRNTSFHNRLYTWILTSLKSTTG